MFPVIQESKLFGAFHIWKGNDLAAGPLPAGRWCQRFGLLEEDVRTRLPRFGLPVRCVVFFIDYSRISPGGPRKPPGCCWRSSDPLLPPGFPSLIQLVCVKISWTMKKLMLLTGLDFNQAPHGPCVSRRGTTQTVGSWPIFSSGGGDPPRERFFVRSMEAKHVTEPSWENSERLDQLWVSFFSPLWFWDSSVGWWFWFVLNV